jgi:hypothetical protein
VTTPIRSASVVPITVPVSSDHGTDMVSDTQAAVVPRPDVTDADYTPAAWTGSTIVFPVGPGTDVGTLTPGRNWVYVRFLDGQNQVELAAGTIDVDTGGVVSSDELAARLGLGTVTDDQRALLDYAIADATAQVEAYLGQTLTPREVTDTAVAVPYGGVDVRPYLSQQPVVRVLSMTETTATDLGVHYGQRYTVTYLAGLDAATDLALAPIRSYVAAAAMNSPQVLQRGQRVNPEAGRTLTSVSVEGQTVGFSAANLGGGGAAGSGAPGALPKITSLSRWKVAGRRVYQRPGIAPDPLAAGGAWRWL